ncbi:rRNA processing/ribosome biogenesis-domain-containing protein [Gigaspora rosea]|uniref:Pre-rRNA-processing protein RIX1 n=1 Tax=Gigaspora rosea TaxID=44941 RepID=A0A397UVY2_9GLOM|nr:rRNA processing/ribosome biogenesis-domain-containing protein [Gigaspora rosea]
MLDLTKLLHSLVVNYTLNDNTVDSFVPFILETIANYQLLATEKAGQEAGSAEQGSIHKWCTRINSLLQSKVSGAKWAGISFVKISIQQSETLFIQNLQSWSSALLTLLTRPESTLILSDVILTLSNMFGKTINKPELQREVTSQQLPRFNTILLNQSANQELLSTIFDALSQSCIQFPTIFRPFVENTQKLCLGVLDGTFDYGSSVVQSAANCLASITNTGGKTNSLVHWKSISLRLIGSLNFLLDRLFDTIDEGVNKQYLIFSADAILLELIFDLNYKMLEKHASNNLPQFEFPSVSDDYIIAFPILFSRFQCLCECIISLVRLLRNSIYRLTSLCIQKYGIGFVHFISSPLLASIIDDIRIKQKPQRDVLTDIISNTGKKGGKNKKRQITNSDELINSGIQEFNNVNVDVQISALEVLKTLLMVDGSSIPYNIRSTIDNIILSRILAPFSQLTNSSSTTRNENDIQFKLYEYLLALIVAPSAFQPTILPHALRIFSSGLNAQSRQLQLFSSQALAICDLMLHSRLPPLQRLPNDSISLSEKNIHESESKETGNNIEPKENSNNIEPEENDNKIEPKENDNIEPKENDNIIEPKENDNIIESKENDNIIESEENDNNIEPKENIDEHLKNEGETIEPSIHTLKFSEIDLIPEHSNKKRVHSGDGSDFDAENQARMFKSFRSDDYTDSDNEDEEMPEIVPDGPDSDYESLDE